MIHSLTAIGLSPSDKETKIKIEKADRFVTQEHVFGNWGCLNFQKDKQWNSSTSVLTHSLPAI